MLWPSVAEGQALRAQRRIVSVTTAILKNADDPPSLATLSGGEVEAFALAAFVSGMGSWLGYWHERGRLVACGELSEVLRTQLRHGRRRASRMHGRLGTVLAAFRERDIEPVLLKGGHTGRVYFPEPGTRPMADFDLLVRPRDLQAAHSALTDAGFSQVSQSRRGESQWAADEATRAVRSVNVEHEDNPWTIDLHVSLDRRYLGGATARFGEWSWRLTEPLDIASSSARVMAQPLLTAYLAQHAGRGIHWFRMIRLVELVLVLERDVTNGSLEWDSLARLLFDGNLQRFVYPALELAARLVPGVVDPDIRREITTATTRRMRRVVERVESEGFQGWGRRRFAALFMWASTWAQTLRAAGELAWPRASPGGVAGLWAAYRRRIELVRRGLVSFR